MVEITCNICNKTYSYSELCYHKYTDKCRYCVASEKMKTTFKNKSIEEKEKTLLKRKKTCIEKYGHDNPSKSNLIKEKISKSNKLKSKSALKKRKQTNLIKFGENYAILNKKCIKKRNNTNLNKTIEEKNIESIRISEGLKLHFYNKIHKTNRLKGLVIPKFDFNQYQGVSKEYSWECNMCGYVFNASIDDGMIPTCQICFPKVRSKKEEEITDYLSSINIKFKRNIRKTIYPQELDVYIPSKKLAIEFNGTYWHSTNRIKNRWYHQMKVEKCSRLGIRLLHIYEWEWNNNRQKCIDKINYYLTHDDMIFSRKPIARFIKNNKETFKYNSHTYIVWD